MRYPTTDDKIIVSRSEHDGHWIYFSVRDARDQGTIVDFVQRRGGGTLGVVRRELLPWIGAERPQVAQQLYVPTVEPRTFDCARVARVFETTRLAANSAYLNSRGIRPALLCSDRFTGTFRPDRHGNVIFPHRDGGGLAGFESKNHGWTSFSAGGVRALWSSNIFPDDRRLILVESAIDALSFHQVHAAPRVRYASTAGTLSEHQRRLVAEALNMLPPGMTVGLSFDVYPAGDKLADQVQALRGRGFARPSSHREGLERAPQHLERDQVRAPTPSRSHSRSR